MNASLPSQVRTQQRAPRTRPPVVPSAVLGMLLFVTAELMFFSGLISAFTISRAGAPPGTWPAPGQPTLPAAATAFNTVLLLASGVALALSERTFRKNARTTRWLMTAAVVLGATFVALQGREWVSLLSQGLTLTSSRLGSFFYLVVGMHAAHALAAILALGVALVRLVRGRLTASFLVAVEVFWTFVVVMWPVIYGRVYF